MTDKRHTPLATSDLTGQSCTTEVLLDKLKMTPFFSFLNNEQLKEVQKKFSTKYFQRDEIIYRQGESAAFMRIVVHGGVKLLRNTMDGKEVLLDMLKPGEYFGSLQALGDKEYTETAQAQTDTCVISIDSNDFRSVLQTYPPVALAVVDITAKRLQHSQEKIQQLSAQTVKERVANILLTLSEKFGEDSTKGTLIQLPISRKDLAGMAGTSAETASRILSTFQEEGVITSGRQWIAINKPEELQV